jgi:hypothetical protein
VSNLDKMIKLNADADEYLERYNEAANEWVEAIIGVFIILAFVAVPVAAVGYLISLVF